MVLACCLFWLLLDAWPAAAGHLAIQVQAQAWLGPQGLVETRAVVTNRGDEPALNLQATALHPPGGASSAPLEELLPGQNAELGLSQAAGPALPGRHAVVLRLDLHDLNHYPLSALGHAHYTLGQEQPSPLVVEARPLELRGRGSLALRLANPGPPPLQVAVRAFAPRELGVDQKALVVDLPAGQFRDLGLPINNLGGQPGAQYPLLILTACDWQGWHDEQVVEARVTLAPEGNPFRQRLPWWLGLLGLLAAWVAGRQIWARRRP